MRAVPLKPLGPLVYIKNILKLFDEFGHRRHFKQQNITKMCKVQAGALKIYLSFNFLIIVLAVQSLLGKGSTLKNRPNFEHTCVFNAIKQLVPSHGDLLLFICLL